MQLLPVLHRQQREQADCLLACAEMVLAYNGVRVGRRRLRRLLNIRPFGAVFSHIENIRKLGITVRVDERDMAVLSDYLEQEIPVIVAVDTGQLRSYWESKTGHAVVVVGLDGEDVIIHDPALAEGFHRVSAAELELAWLEKNYLFAVILPST